MTFEKLNFDTNGTPYSKHSEEYHPGQQLLYHPINDSALKTSSSALVRNLLEILMGFYRTMIGQWQRCYGSAFNYIIIIIIILFILMQQ